MNWTLDQFKAALKNQSQVKAWVITQEHTHRRERYFLLDGETLVADQDREVSAQSISARIFVTLSKAGRQGEIAKKFFPALALQPQLDSAIEAALQTDHQSWDLPQESYSKLPALSSADPKIAEDVNGVMDELTTRMSLCAAQSKPSCFNSAELFVSLHDRELHLSNGLIHRSSQSRIYTEAAYSMTRKKADNSVESDEYLNTRWAVSVGDLKLESLFDETAERAERSLDVTKPETGKYPVIVDADVLATLFNGHVSQLTASHSYNGLPFIKPGEDFIPKATGDLITLSLDPTLAFGADTTAVSEQGVKLEPLPLVEKNKVVATAADKQYADYLNLRATSVRGNVVVEPGTLSYSELTQSAPRVIEILQFSGLFADPNSGTFSSEIRLARLYDNVKGTVSYIKGGSLSGSVTENFRGARLSKERVKHAHFSAGASVGQGYYGPSYALLSDVSIVG